MGDNQTTTTSGSASPAVRENIDKLVGKVGNLSDQSYPVFDQSLYPGLSGTTQGGIQGLLNASNNGIYTSGINSGLNYATGLAGGAPTSITEQNLTGLAGTPGTSLTEQNLMGVAQGQNFGMDDPGYATLRNNVANDTMTGINAMFSNSGRLGSGSNVKSASEGVANALAGLDYQNYQNDIARQERALSSIEGQRQQGLANQMGALSAIEGQRQQGVNNTFAAQSALPGLLEASSAPSQMQLTAGSLLDADAAAKLQGDQDLFLRQNLAPYTQLGSLSSILAGTAPSAGTTTTTTQPTQNPLLGLLGAGLAFL